jgi:HD-GYP domain-containing protein (c-di-GMP phosphodiesterase class II)
MSSSSDFFHKLDDGGTADFQIGRLSSDKKLNKLLKSVVSDVKFYAEDQIRRINQLVQIGIALSVEKDINVLLEMIVDDARSLTDADGGTLYLLDEENKQLYFKILQNDSMNFRSGGTSGRQPDLPPIQLFINGTPNYSNVSSYVALTGETKTFSDVYKADGFDFTGPRKFDEINKYRTKSMLVVALKNYENKIIGVLQLLNAKDPSTGEIIPFSDKYVDLVASLASQAAIALTNNVLIRDLHRLFDSFIESIALAIGKKSLYTGEHIRRVVVLAMIIAEKVNAMEDGPLGQIQFSREELNELRMAAWMHDLGKVTTPDYVLDKSSRLEKIYDRIHLIETRFQLIEKSIENDCLHRKISLMAEGVSSHAQIQRLESVQALEIETLRSDLAFIKACNHHNASLTDKEVNRLKEIAARTYLADGKEYPYLTADELKNLSVRKGTLTDDERKIVENHVSMTEQILNRLPFPKRLANVAKYASSHHEKMDGSGYPKGLLNSQLPLQSRILVVADIFEALTARDRPYREPMKLSKALDILDSLKQNKQIDPDILELFIDSKLYLEYANQELEPKQIDISN